MLNPNEKLELVRLQRQALQDVETDNWRDFESIAERLEELMTRWSRETHYNLGTQ